MSCMDCGRSPADGWSIDHALWNLVVGGPEAPDDPGGLLCLTCFVVRAEPVLGVSIWRLEAIR